MESHICQLSQCLLSGGNRVKMLTYVYDVTTSRNSLHAEQSQDRKAIYVIKCIYVLILFDQSSSILWTARHHEHVFVSSAFSPLALKSKMHAKALGLRALYGTNH
uniref:Uncharacterized protein n=1 Tax=Echinococcus canadensis TaxID=519352 RepID=A0A915EYK5_9CEST